MSTPKEGPGAHIHRVGDAEVIILADGYRRFPLPDGFVTNAAREDVSRALVEAGMPADEMTIHFNPAVIRHRGRTVLIDTGNGPAAAAEEGTTRGLLMASLAQAGISPSEIDTVAISHFHGDHVNGLVDSSNAPAFPQAEVLVPEREWTYWMEEVADGPADQRIKDMARATRAVFAGVEDRVTRYGWDQEIAPGLFAVATPGHTPGHTSFRLESDGDALFILSDVTNNPALFARHPGWHAVFDMDPKKAEATRRRIYDMLCDTELPVLGFHFPFPAIGRAVREGDGYRIV
ncbi:MBL fold metallo-hydrolase [Rhodobacteraceae bacterium WD3A24]|nr:MBL fold metallo-hydrolase [Rhodobacteraceae bacterium WD3A24]